jgi:linoleoyl-CoA desaturase
MVNDAMVSEAPRVHFCSNGPFQVDLKQRVEAYFEGQGRSRHGGFAIALKSSLLASWLVASYATLMLAPVNAVGAVLLSLSSGLAMAGIGFCIMHDGNHDAFSSIPGVNKLAGFTLDLLGGSSYYWHQKHNVLHHTYPNISGLDDDIEVGSPMVRLAPWQPRHFHHRFQHLYVWALYALFPLGWWLVDDTTRLITGRIGGHPVPRPRGGTLAGLLGGKALFFTWAFALPAFAHPGWQLVPLWIIATSALGITLGTVFQLAHCVGEADFLECRGQENGLEWATHQVNTAVDFGRENRLLSWYVGGLNFQIEHHLFPRVCHLHYRALAPIVEETCRAHQIPYRTMPTFRSSVAANLRWLRRMGAPV